MAYITNADLKESLGISSSDSTKDDIVTYAVDAAISFIDNYTGRSFSLDSNATSRIYVPTPCDDFLATDDIGSTSGLVVENGDITGSTWTTVDSATYEAFPLNSIIKGKPIVGFTMLTGWGVNPYARIRVTAKWGWPEVPDEIAQAALLQAARLFKRKDSPGGMFGSADFGFTRVSKADPDVVALIAPFIRHGFGS